MWRNINGKAVAQPDRELDEFKAQIRNELDTFRSQTSQISIETNQKLKELSEYVSRVEVSFQEFDQRLETLVKRVDKGDSSLQGEAMREAQLRQVEASLQDIDLRLKKLDSQIDTETKQQIKVFREYISRWERAIIEYEQRLQGLVTRVSKAEGDRPNIARNISRLYIWMAGSTLVGFVALCLSVGLVFFLATNGSRNRKAENAPQLIYPTPEKY